MTIALAALGRRQGRSSAANRTGSRNRSEPAVRCCAAAVEPGACREPSAFTRVAPSGQRAGSGAVGDWRQPAELTQGPARSCRAGPCDSPLLLRLCDPMGLRLRDSNRRSEAATEPVLRRVAWRQRRFVGQGDRTALCRASVWCPPWRSKDHRESLRAKRPGHSCDEGMPFIRCTPVVIYHQRPSEGPRTVLRQVRVRRGISCWRRRHSCGGAMSKARSTGGATLGGWPLPTTRSTW
jgi:hypothetical protein